LADADRCYRATYSRPTSPELGRAARGSLLWLATGDNHFGECIAQTGGEHNGVRRCRRVAATQENTLPAYDINPMFAAAPAFGAKGDEHRHLMATHNIFRAGKCVSTPETRMAVAAATAARGPVPASRGAHASSE
jgi:hypothetical protein